MSGSDAKKNPASEIARHLDPKTLDKIKRLDVRARAVVELSLIHI